MAHFLLFIYVCVRSCSTVCNKPCLPCRRPSFWFRTFVFSLAILAYLNRPPLPRQHHHLAAASNLLATAPHLSPPLSLYVVRRLHLRVHARFGSWPPFLRIYHRIFLLGHSDPAIYRTYTSVDYHLPVRYTALSTSSYFVGNSTLQPET